MDEVAGYTLASGSAVSALQSGSSCPQPHWLMVCVHTGGGGVRARAGVLELGRWASDASYLLSVVLSGLLLHRKITSTTMCGVVRMTNKLLPEGGPNKAQPRNK